MTLYGRTSRALNRAFREVPLPVNAHDAEQFPNIADAGKHLASLSSERRAELERDWL